MPDAAPRADPLVSVVIAAYNARRYVRKTIESVLWQTVSDLELIFVDDGSADGTADLVAGIQDQRIRIIRRENGGPSAARNCGLRLARSRRFIALLDADDAWDPDKLQQQIAFLEAHRDCAVAGCFMRYVSSTGRVLGRTGQTVDTREQPRVASGELFPFPLSSFLVRRQAFDDVGGFDDAIGRPSGGAEDIDWLARLSHAGAIGCVPTVLGSYRIHPDSAMARDRLRINQEARFIRRRLAARRDGRELTWDEFADDDRPTWRDRRRDYVELWYRSAALWYGEGQPLRALLFGLGAAMLDPRYTVRRVYLQRLRDRAVTRLEPTT